MRLYLGHLSYKAAATGLEGWFTQPGFTVSSVGVVRDRSSGEARRFGFVKIADDQDAARAIPAWNGKQLMGRPLVVNEARPMAPAGGGGTNGAQKTSARAKSAGRSNAAIEDRLRRKDGGCAGAARPRWQFRRSPDPQSKAPE